MLERAAKILERNACDHCIGRQFGQLLSGLTNGQRGRIVREAVAVAIDSGEKLDVEPDNFYGFKFRQNQEFEKMKKKHVKCEVCNGLFENLDKYAKKAASQLSKIDYNTFLVGTQLSQDLIDREEKLWQHVGIDYAEPLKAELNREIGKRIAVLTGKKADLKKPDIAILVDMTQNKIRLKVNPLFVFGYYKKMKRGIPQSRWGTPGHYKTSVEEEIARPLMKLSKGKDHAFHGMGREDIDALCLDWRAFVVEIKDPKKRDIDFRKLEKSIKKGNKVAVSKLKISNMDTVRKIKSATPDKTYRALVKLRKVKRTDLKKLVRLEGTILQKTPERVVHRRADIERKRAVREVKWKMRGKNLELVVTGTSGLYIKELVSGDNGRTKPSVSEILDVPAKVKELDVIKIGKIKL